jgi:hypothetical protein
MLIFPNNYQLGETASKPRLIQDPFDMSCVRFFNPEP